jgi:hypothetical protein
LITAADMVVYPPGGLGGPALTPPHHARIPAMMLPRVAARPRLERALTVVLYITILVSSLAFIEPSPHDVMMLPLGVLCLAAGIRIDRSLILLLLLLLLWDTFGLFALMNVPDNSLAIQYAATSFYLSIAALIFALLLAQNTMPRLAALRAAYILTATLSSLVGIAGYFRLFPGAYDLFTFEGGRVVAGFKDPNVFAPFLIWPTLVVLERIIARRIRLIDLVTAGILLFALLLAFSRGAWFHFALSCAVMLALIFLTAPTQRARLRIFSLSAVCVCALVALVAVLLSFESIRTMFLERAQLVQSYDVGSGGRFTKQEQAVTSVLQSPNGLGPFEFARINGLQQHNVYLQAFLVYGWAGGMSYLLLLFATLLVGLRASLSRTPWQPYVIVAFATFVGEVAEGFIIDTDHWRHFFLLLGMVWGLSAATSHYRRQKRAGLV